VLRALELIIFIVKPRECSEKLTEILVEALSFCDLLLMGVAGIILVEELIEVNKSSNDFKGIIDEPILDSLSVDASLEVIHAPVFQVIGDSLHSTLFNVAGQELSTKRSPLLEVFVGKREEVSSTFLFDLVHLVSVFLHPVTEALVSDDVGVRGIHTFNESLGANIEHASEFFESGHLRLGNLTFLRGLKESKRVVVVGMVRSSLNTKEA